MNWIKRHWYDVGIGIGVVMALFVLGHTACEWTAYAQKPEQRWYGSGNSNGEYCQVAPDGSLFNCYTANSSQGDRAPMLGVKELPAWIESNCVAVIPWSNTVTVEVEKEQTLKLRCSDKK